jgi:hypothetical protein
MRFFDFGLPAFAAGRPSNRPLARPERNGKARIARAKFSGLETHQWDWNYPEFAIKMTADTQSGEARNANIRRRREHHAQIVRGHAIRSGHMSPCRPASAKEEVDETRPPAFRRLEDIC